ncbi:MAG: ISAs1 family transposase [Candidatus Competibacteraceae bacterium]
MTHSTQDAPSEWPTLQSLLHDLSIEPLVSDPQIARAAELLDEHHYLGAPNPVGERLWYAALGPAGRWLAVLLFTAASRRLRHRDEWIGWSDEQRRRRLPLVANNARFLILPETNTPNLATAVLSRVAARLSDDWMERYGHPVLIVESFVDPQLFRGTVYKAANWTPLGLTQGHQRVSRDYYEAHDRPKLLFARELAPNARRSLRAEHLKPALAAVEAASPPRCTQQGGELKSLVAMFRERVPEYRQRKRCTYPVHTLLGIMAAAHLADAPRGQKDLEVFAKRLSQRQLKALGVRRDGKARRYPSPDQTTFSRLMSQVDADVVEQVLIEWQQRVRGPVPDQETVAIDGKQPKHAGGHNVVTAITTPSQHFLGCELVEDKSNEIPAARALIGRLDLDGKLVSLDALHSCQQTARQIVLEAGADYSFTIKDNTPAIKERIEALLLKIYFIISQVPSRFFGERW